MTDRMTDDEIAEARRVIEAATPGPWEAVQSDDEAHLDWIAARYLSGEPDHVALIGKRPDTLAIAEVGRSSLEQQNDAFFSKHLEAKS